MSDLEQKLEDIEGRLPLLESRALEGGAYREEGGDEITLRDTFRYVSVMGHLINGMNHALHCALENRALKPHEMDDLRRRFADYDSYVMSLHRHG